MEVLLTFESTTTTQDVFFTSYRFLTPISLHGRSIIVGRVSHFHYICYFINRKSVSLGSYRVIGFMKSSSKASLIGGTAAAASFGLSAYLINKNNDLGYDVGYLTSMGLIAKFGPSQFDKPSLRGGIAVAAVVVGAYNGLKSFEAKGIM